MEATEVKPMLVVTEYPMPVDPAVVTGTAVGATPNVVR
jgi:hypothetical protein